MLTLGARVRLGLLAAVTALLAAQSKPPVDSPEVVEIDSMELRIQRGSSSWRVDLSNLIRARDRAWRMLDDVPICRGNPSAPCQDCLRRASVVGWDRSHQRLFFGVSTGISQNNPWTIFSYSLVTRRVSRFTNSWGAGIQNGTVSRDGRYLAYVSYGHSGMCSTFSTIEIADLWNHRLASPKEKSENPDDVTLVDAVDWVSPTLLEYEATVHGYEGCRAGKNVERKVAGKLDAATLTFR